MKNKPDLTILILTWNGEAVIEKCINSIINKKYDFNYKILVVDNGSNDDTKKILAKFKEKIPNAIEIIENKKNFGYAKGNNIGLKKVNSKYTLLLNQDIEFQSKALSHMFQILDSGLSKNDNNKEPKPIAAVSPMLVYPDGRIQKSLRVFPSPLNVIKDLLSMGKWHENQYDHTKSQYVDQPMASCLMVSTKVLKEIKGFDDHKNFFLFFNDVDLSKRIANLDYAHYYSARSKVIHHHGESTRKWSNIGRIKAWCRGLYYFLVKHYAKRKPVKRFFIFFEVIFVFIARITHGTIMRVFKYNILERKK